MNEKVETRDGKCQRKMNTETLMNEKKKTTMVLEQSLVARQTLHYTVMLT